MNEGTNFWVSDPYDLAEWAYPTWPGGALRRFTAAISTVQAAGSSLAAAAHAATTVYTTGRFYPWRLAHVTTSTHSSGSRLLAELTTPRRSAAGGVQAGGCSAARAQLDLEPIEEEELILMLTV